MSQSVIAFENVSFAYDGGPAVLEDVSFSIAAGELVCIVGPNGGGKTTLLRLALGLNHPTSGRVRIFGQSPKSARPRIGYLPQHTDFDVRFPISVLDVVLMGRLGGSGWISRLDRRDKARALSLLDDAGLAGFRHRPFSSLSGGQQQRVLIARALACSPDLMIMDEPAANLDLPVQDDLYSLLHRLQKQMTVVFTSHDVGFVTHIVKRVICVNRTVSDHPTSALTGDVMNQVYGRDVRLVDHMHSHG